MIAVGTRLQDFTTGSWALFKNPNLRIVSINTARWDANKQHATPVIGDALVALGQLDGALGGYAAPPEWLQVAQAEIGKWNAHLDGIKNQEPGTVASYAQVIQTVNELCDPDDYCVSAAGGLPGELVAGWRTKQVGTFDTEFGYSTMGYEIAGGLGAKMARPDADVIAFVGDGSYLMMNSDIYATVFTGHKVIFIVCDNAGFASINNLQTKQGGVEFNNLLRSARHAGQTTFARVDFAKHAESLGATSEHVAGIGELPAAFGRAKASARSYVIVVDVAHDQWVGGGSWWEVGVPEVSTRDEVLVARAVYEAESKHQRVGV